ncbi:SMP-30/gluconolactonase/LRE family protein [Mycobacterium yunnanensis]|uniref:SMP-30/gluconolactonase/LRE family protein n=1 Tax=Mycobacterium yunnanensis TaxID=368477 RepID=A0A9X2YJI8_9MYCO|nr:SMP-30/gluconolactonase/LRE family protein [Mycobacterium yunnanensis]MCV7420523.1 SMP-30/gluconolactonase/LRE family protein [Mycobacterium yunnanensis]
MTDSATSLDDDRQGGWHVAAPTQASLGERPVWDERTGTLVFVDIDRGELHRFNPEDGQSTVAVVGASVGCVGLRNNGGVVLGTDAGFVLADATGETRDDPIVPPGMTSAHFFNDGACDPAGRFVAGTSTTERTTGAASLYSLAPDGAVRVLLPEVTESNGVAWSLDGRQMFYVDSGTQDVMVFDYDPADGTATSGTVLFSIDEQDGVPDGLIVDAEDTLWLALWSGHGIRRYRSDGVLLSQITIPAKDVTCAAFGGADLTDLYVTTSRGYLEPGEVEAYPHAGDLFVLQTGATGCPTLRYGG